MARPAKPWAKWARGLGWVAVVLGATAFIGSIVVVGQLTARSGTYQLVKRTPQAELFGEVGEPIGTPQVYVVDDPKAILPGETPEGVKYLDDGYLREKGAYPLQMRTVDTVSLYTRLGSGVAIFAGLGALILTRRRT